jgi:hypothetical protein
MRSFLLLSAITLFFSVCSIFGNRGLLSQEIQSVKLKLNAKTNSDNGLLINQSILNTLSTGTTKPLQQLQIDILVDYICTIGGPGFYNTDIIFKILEINGEGDDIYRKFPVKAFLKPDIFSGNYSVKEDDRTVNTGTFKVQKASESGFAKIGQIDPIKMNASEVTADIISFSFSNQARDRFQEVISQINEYWAIANLIDSLIVQANANENEITEEPADIFVFWDKLRKSRSLSDEAIAKTSTFSPDFDPAGLNEKKIIINRLITRFATLYTTATNKKVVDVDFARNLAEKQLTSMTDFILKSSSTNFRDSDLILKASRLILDNEMSSMLRISSPKSDNQLAAALLFGGLVSVADSLFAKSDFSNALSFYEDAIEMNDKYDFVDDKTALQERTDAAKLGLLQSHMKIAARAVETGNEALANTYKQKSNSFVNEKLNDNVIGQLPEQSDELVQIYIRKGNNFLDQKLYSDAIKEFELAASTARDYYSISHNEKITQGLFAAYRAVYLDLVNDAENFYKAGRIEDAKNRLQKALDYRQDHVVYLRSSTEAIYLLNRINNPNNTAISATSNELQMQILAENGLISNSNTIATADPEAIKSAKSNIIEQLKAVQLKVWGNAIDEAWTIYENALENQKRFGLEADNDIKKIIDDLDQKMIERICLNNKFRSEDLMSKLKSNIRNRNYENLKSMLEEVISIATNNQGCGLNPLEANNIYNQFLQLFQYQQDYNLVLEKIFGEGIYNTTDAYLKFDKTVEMYQLGRFGIQHTTFKDFLIKQNNSALTLQALKYFLDNLNVDGILEYLEVLKSQSFTSEQSFEIQQGIGTLLAVADNTIIIEKPEAQILKITGGDSRFNELKKSYLRSMKELKRNKR